MFAPVTTTHHTAYLSSMASALEEKLFFLPHLDDVDMVVDFGCADGRILEVLAKTRPDLALVGHDLDPLMLRKTHDRVPNARLSGSLETLYGITQGRRVAVIASSVYHEICSYGGGTAEQAFWDFLTTPAVRMVAWRDMAVSNTDLRPCPPPLLPIPAWQRSSFEAIWGPITQHNHLIHLLLKLPWVDNWDREVREQYLPRTREWILARLRPQFRVDHTAYTPIPIQTAWRDTWGFETRTRTHLRLIATKLDTA